MDKDKITSLNEAPASVTYSLTSPGGFNILFTVRDTSGTELLGKMLKIEDRLQELGYKPQERKPAGSFAKKEVIYVEGEVCPKCGAPVIERTKQDGRKYHVCSTSKYDFKTKTSSGCSYFAWK